MSLHTLYTREFKKNPRTTVQKLEEKRKKKEQGDTSGLSQSEESQDSNSSPADNTEKNFTFSKHTMTPPIPPQGQLLQPGTSSDGPPPAGNRSIVHVANA